MALLEIDEFAVNAADYERAKCGDRNAQLRIKTALEGQVLYVHAFPVSDTETVVSLRELEAIDALDSITLHAFTALSGT